MTDSQPIALPELLQHRAWMKSLARTLVGDPAKADDAVQEAWLSALVHPPSDRRNLRGWLGSVLRNAVRQRARGGQRRERREADATTAESIDPAAVVERFDTQRQVADLVMVLPEPERTCLLLRFYEDLTSAQIATRLDLPASTVRWRIQEALRSLRDALDRAHGDRQSWCLALLPFLRDGVPVGAVATAFTGVVLMKTALKATAAAVLVVASWFTLEVTGLMPFSGSPDYPSDEALPVEFVAIAETSVDAPAERAELESPAPAEERSASSASPDVVAGEGAFVGRIVDVRGRALRATVTLTQPRHSVATGADGGFRLPLPGWGPDSYRIQVSALSHVTRFVDAAYSRKDQVVQVGDLVLEAGGSISGRVVDRLGEIMPGAVVGLADDAPTAREYEGWRRDWADEDDGDFGGRTLSVSCDDRGEFVLAGLPVGRVRLLASAGDHLASLTRPVEVRGGQSSTGVEVVLDPLGDADLIEGVVIDPFGEPVVRADLRFEYRSLFGRGTGSRSVGRDGRFRIITHEGTWDLTAHDSDRQYGEAIFEGARPGMRDLVLQLEAAEAVRLRILAEGDLSDVAVGLYSPDHRKYFRRGDLVERGLFEFIAPKKEFVVAVEGHGFVPVELGPFTRDSLGGELEVRLEAAPMIRGVATIDGEPAVAARVELREYASEWTEVNGFPTWVRSSAADHEVADERGEFAVQARHAGRYLVRVEADGYAPYEIGPLDVDPELEVTGLEAPLTVGGSLVGVVLSMDGNGTAGAIVGISRGDGHAQTTRAGADGAFHFDHLMPGDWQVDVVARELVDGASSSRANSYRGVEQVRGDVTIVNGEEARFDPGDRSTTECTLTGRFNVGDVDMSGWTAEFVQLTGGMTETEADVALSPDGTFELTTSTPGPMRLRFRDTEATDATVLGLVELNLVVGAQRWERRVASGAASIGGVPKLARGSGVADAGVIRWVEGDLTILGLLHGKNGQCQLSALPAGAWSFTRADRAAMASEVDPRDWPEIGSFEVKARGEVRVEFPGGGR